MAGGWQAPISFCAESPDSAWLKDAAGVLVWQELGPWEPGGRPPVSAIAIRVPLPGTTFINAANEAEFPLPIVDGDRLTVIEEVVSVSPEKQSRLGVGHFIETLDTFTRQDGAIVATNRNTLFRFTPAAA